MNNNFNPIHGAGAEAMHAGLRARFYAMLNGASAELLRFIEMNPEAVEEKRLEVHDKIVGFGIYVKYREAGISEAHIGRYESISAAEQLMEA